jgi:hypothetical protein
VDWLNTLEGFLRQIDSIDPVVIQKLKFENMPERFYKYRVFGEWTFDNLKEGREWAVSPLGFNDPFDCALNIQLDAKSKPIFQKYYPVLVDRFRQETGIQINDDTSKLIAQAEDPISELLTQAKPWLLREMDPAEFNAFAQAFRAAQIQYLAKLSTSMRTHLASQVAVVPLTVKVDSIPMWSYYADSHRGFCVEYDLKSLGPENLQVRALYPVLYNTEWPNATDTTVQAVAPSEGMTDNTTILSVLTKSAEWRHEQEWRMIFPRKPDVEKFPVYLRIKAVYLGVKMLSDSKASVVNWATEHHVRVYEMVLHRTQYRIVPNLLK